MKDGRVFKYDVANSSKAREHAARIATEGYRNLQDGIMEYYPVHTIFKITFAMPDADEQATKYKAKV